MKVGGSSPRTRTGCRIPFRYRQFVGASRHFLRVLTGDVGIRGDEGDGKMRRSSPLRVAETGCSLNERAARPQREEKLETCLFVIRAPQARRYPIFLVAPPGTGIRGYPKRKVVEISCASNQLQWVFIGRSPGPTAWAVVLRPFGILG